MQKKTLRLFVSCAGSLESLLTEELKELGLRSVESSFRGVFVPNTMENVYTINYMSRLATRVLFPIISFACPDAKALYDGIRGVDWGLYSHPSKTFSIDANISSHPTLKNSHFASLLVKDAICDAQREIFNQRSSIDQANPDLQFNLFVHKGQATLYFDTSGQPLFKRGYRTQSGVAPLQESLAAAILRLAKYQPEDILADPFAGSGTFLIEAAMISTNTPPGFFRKCWGFEHMPQFDPSLWKSGKKIFDSKKIPLLPGKLFGADQDLKAVELCRRHLDLTGFGSSVDVVVRSVERFNPPKKPTLIVANPPYGHRIERKDQLVDQFKQFLSTLSPRATYFLVPEKQHIDMPSSKVFSCLNGGLPVELLVKF